MEVMKKYREWIQVWKEKDEKYVMNNIISLYVPLNGNFSFKSVVGVDADKINNKVNYILHTVPIIINFLSEDERKQIEKLMEDINFNETIFTDVKQLFLLIKLHTILFPSFYYTEKYYWMALVDGRIDFDIQNFDIKKFTKGEHKFVLLHMIKHLLFSLEKNASAKKFISKKLKSLLLQVVNDKQERLQLYKFINDFDIDGLLFIIDEFFIDNVERIFTKQFMKKYTVYESFQEYILKFSSRDWKQYFDEVKINKIQVKAGTLIVPVSYLKLLQNPKDSIFVKIENIEFMKKIIDDLYFLFKTLGLEELTQKKEGWNREK